MTNPSGLCASRAESLDPGVPYVQGWAESKRATEALAEQLRSAALADDFTTLKADVNVFGEGVICLGTIRPEATVRLASLLTVGLLIEQLDEWSREDGIDPNEAPWRTGIPQTRP
ncbi:hypothetical protein [Actinacidiphila alni]|uniref:hypothetical protein n=1 Tax=Actinacidiphila alni TaxID=380248 RepID=UPI003454807B